MRRVGDRHRSRSAPTRQPRSRVPDLALIPLGGCAALVDGRLRCWGSDGLDSLSSSRRPGPIPKIADAIQVAFRGYTPLVLRRDGTVIETRRPGGRVAPFAVIEGVDHAVEVAGGTLHACARTAGGTVLCWGSNDGGLLGQPPPAADVDAPRPVLR